ncbi:hypothetical protein ABTI37_19855, partial [Acinetobacter baumannii]
RDTPCQRPTGDRLICGLRRAYPQQRNGNPAYEQTIVLHSHHLHLCSSTCIAGASNIPHREDGERQRISHFLQASLLLQCDLSRGCA